MLDLPFPALESLELENIPSPDSCGLQQSASVVKWNSIGATKVGRENLTRLTTRMVFVNTRMGTHSECSLNVCFEFSSAGFQSSPRDRVPFCKGRLKNQTTTQQVGKTLLETLNTSSEGIPPQL